jgi:hypothetical protein
MKAHLETSKNIELSGLGGKRKRRKRGGAGKEEEENIGNTPSTQIAIAKIKRRLPLGFRQEITRETWSISHQVHTWSSANFFLQENGTKLRTTRSGSTHTLQF